MSKYNFRSVRKLQNRINQEVYDYKKLEDVNIEDTIIPNLLSNLFDLDEPAWEESIGKHRNILLGNN